MHNNDTQNKYIYTLITNEKEKENGIENEYSLVLYNPYIIDTGILCTNMILRTLLQDDCAEWHNPQIYRNTFGKIQHFNGNKFPFEKIYEYTPDPKVASLFYFFNKQKIKFTSAIINNETKEKNDNKGITNIWIVIENPNNLKLNDIIKSIYVECGGINIHRFCTNNIENEINILAYIFRCDGIQYQNNKIYIPLIIPYNSFIFYGSYHNANIRLEYHETIFGVSYKIYGTIIDKSVFPKIKNSNSFYNKCEFIFYQLQYTGPDIITSYRKKLKILFGHPIYVMYLMNISKEYVQSIKLFLSYYDGIDEFEYTDFTIEWFDNHAIVWLNKDFLTFEKLNKNINFSVCATPYLLIENTYQTLQQVELLAVSFNTHLHDSGLTGLKFGG